MPSTSPISLYLGECIKELDAKTEMSDLKSKSTSKLINSAKSLFKAAEKSYVDRDEEKAYVLYSRFIELLLQIRKRPDYAKEDQTKCLSEFANPALSKAESLKSSLIQRYKVKKELDLKQNDLKKNVKNDMLTELHKNQLPNIKENKDIPEAADPVESSISSIKLHSLLTTSHSNIIIMDTRPAADFKESHIKHSRCISVPQEILTPGTTAMKLESNLPKESLSPWYSRADADYIILLDWDSEHEFSDNGHLNTLKEAMCKWDQKCTLKRAPIILEKGYKDWNRKYPMFTTKPLSFTSMHEPRNSLILMDVSAVEYPSLDENGTDKQPVSNKENRNQTDALFTKISLPNQITNGLSPSTISLDSRKARSAPSVDRKSKPSIDRSLKSSGGEQRQNISPNVSNQRISSPLQEHTALSIDQKSKHTVRSPTPDSKHGSNEMLISSLNKAEVLANENLELVMKQLKSEEEFEKLRLKKELEAEESKRIEIQKQEEKLLETLRRLQLEVKDKDAEMLKVQEENLKMKKILEEQKDIEYQKNREIEIADAINKKKALQESVEKLREDRKKNEALARKTAELSKTNVVPRDVVSANTGLKRNNPDSAKHANSTEYTIPLSRQNSEDVPGHGMVRSHSSPNIAQMLNQEDNARVKTPTIDRTLKPKVLPSSQLSGISRARSRNLNPVYGNCPRATGLKNLGNTCFMNSIIQCLSNTLPLAEYIYSGQYMDDINRYNNQGTGGELAEEFAIVVKNLWMGQYKSFSPKDFKNTVSRCLSVCIGNEQQDSHEFLIVLMEKLHADLNNVDKKYARSSPKLEGTVDENKFWKHHKMYNCSKISNIFEGLLKSTLTCLSCRKTSDSFEVFSCLSLPILSSRCSLRECFQHFLKSEKISGEAAWDCPRCKQKKEAEKKLHICRLPEILIIQLKRFSYEGLWRRKLQTTVDFDLLFDVPCEENSEERYRSYHLYGVVNHFGTLEGGHYTAYCKTESRKWYKYDDHEVSEINPSDIKTPAAYLLFYQAMDVQSRL